MLEKHKYNIYPEIIGEDYEDLKESISKGYDKSFPIILFEDKVLDGWNRYKICLELGISPPTKNFEGTKEEALQFVIRTNNRRHLTTSQRAAIALEYLPLFEAAAKQRQIRKPKDFVVANRPQQKLEANLPQTIKSREEAAAIMGVGSRSVQRAKFVKENSPELFEKILKGEETVNKAEKEIKKKEWLTNKQQEIEQTPANQLTHHFVYDVWTGLSRLTNKVRHPGNIPQEYIENLLYYYTNEGDLVYDPFGGGGPTIDVCKRMNRNYYVSDIAPVREDIKKWNLEEGLPNDLINPILTFLDPPYYKKLEK